MSIRILHTPLEEKLPAPSHVTIGAFDGVHRGHRRLIGSMTQAAHAAQRLAAVVTFDPHPGAVLSQQTMPILSTIGERAALLAEIGVDRLVVLRFTAAVAQTPAIRFVEMLRRDLRMEELWMGPDFALGREREGNVEFLRQAGQEQGFAVRVVPPLTWQGGIISSSRVRSALAAGDLGEVNGCLGRPYRVTGRAISTQPASEAAEHPRVELELPPRRLLPAPGFYAGRASIAAQDLGRAVIDVPAHVPGAPHPVSVRVYLMEDRTPHPGRKMRLSFIARLRNQDEGLNLDAKTFSSAEE